MRDGHLPAESARRSGRREQLASWRGINIGDVPHVKRTSASNLRNFQCFTARVGIAAVCIATASSVHAQLSEPDAVVDEVQATGAFNAERLSPAPGPRNFITTRTARSDGEKSFSVSGLVSYANEPIIVELGSSVCRGRSDCNTRVVQNLATAHLMGSFTPISRLQIGLRVPLVFVQGQGITPYGEPRSLEGKGIEKFGLSDPELEVKLRFLGDITSPIAAGIAAFATAPLGELTAKESYAGSGSVTAGGRLIGDGHFGPVTCGINLGYRYQKSAKIVSEVGAEGFYSAAVGFTPSPIFRVLGEAFGTTQFSSEPGTNTAEALIAAQLTPLSSPLTITLGGGPGLIQGAIGVPRFRAFAGLAYVSEKSDSDADGVADSADQCPTDAEDTDGVEDSDGCPDLDNDGDALPDTADKCPNEAEDLDGFEDADGCPDRDNDKDGIPDVQDRCKGEPENLNGFQDDDGCPDVKDTDLDGVPDADDKCLQDKEDTDGFQDTDGCPDLDNDGDGVPDTSDECVDQAEDMNGLQDEDGCPDLEE